MTPRSFARFVVLVAVLVAGCDSVERTEAKSVTDAVERFRRAENAEKPATIVSLRAARCSAADVCRARDACLASADATSKALVLKNDVEQSMAKLERGELAKDSPEAQGLLGKLDEAEKLLTQGHELLGPCDDQIMGLKRKYRI